MKLLIGNRALRDRILELEGELAGRDVTIARMAREIQLVAEHQHALDLESQKIPRLFDPDKLELRMHNDNIPLLMYDADVLLQFRAGTWDELVALLSNPSIADTPELQE